MPDLPNATDLEPPRRNPSPSSESSRRRNSLLEGLDQFADVVATFTGMRAQLVSNGWSEEQATDMVAYMWGWRPKNGSKPEGIE